MKIIVKMIRRVYNEVTDSAYSILGALYPRRFGIGSRRHFGSNERYKMLEQAFIYTNNEMVAGNYIEFGVARGRTMIFANIIAEGLGIINNVKFYGYDSFEGFPEPEGVDSEFRRFEKGEENWGIEIATKNIRRSCSNPENVELIKGWYEDTLSDDEKQKMNGRKARIINVDCDLYASTLVVLNYVTDLIQTGTVMLFDDWLCYRADPSKGEQAAVNQWIEENPDIALIPYRTYGNVGQSFIVSLNSNPPE